MVYVLHPKKLTKFQYVPSDEEENHSSFESVPSKHSLFVYVIYYNTLGTMVIVINYYTK